VFSHDLRVEGYSNFLWMAVVALRYVFRAPSDPYPFARGAALLSLAICLFVSFRFARRFASVPAAFVALGLLVSCSDLFRAAASGLETIPFTTAIVFGWLVYLSEPPLERRYSLLAFVPAALLRIDGFVPLLVVCAVELVFCCACGRVDVRRLARWALPAITIWCVYFAWRYWYYRLPLPTTYYAKRNVSLGDPDRGLRQAWDFLRDAGALPLLPLMVVPVLRGPQRESIALWAALSLQVAYATTVGGDWMPFNRFFLPIVPLAAVLVGWGAHQLWLYSQGLTTRERWGSRIALAGALTFSAMHLHAARADTPQEKEKLASAKQVARHTEDLLAATDLMALVVRRPGDRLVTDYAGVFSVFTDAEVIDQWGLCNADIALHGDASGIDPIYGKACSACYERLKPDYFHVFVPMVRKEKKRKDSFHNVADVVDHVFQGAAIDEVIHLRDHFAAGRVVEESTRRSLWFLERRRGDLPLVVRRPKPGYRVEYPFEPGGMN
jgi:hypothetical protein